MGDIIKGFGEILIMQYLQALVRIKVTNKDV